MGKYIFIVRKRQREDGIHQMTVLIITIKLPNLFRLLGKIYEIRKEEGEELCRVNKGRGRHLKIAAEGRVMLKSHGL